eukprot:scaffold166402_cov26-Prasinocladus_malaysianus.AAC.1
MSSAQIIRLSIKPIKLEIDHNLRTPIGAGAAVRPISSCSCKSNARDYRPGGVLLCFEAIASGEKGPSSSERFHQGLIGGLAFIINGCGWFGRGGCLFLWRTL